jgi:hypothetical protein
MSNRIIIIEAKSLTKGYHREFIPDEIMELRPTNTWIVTALKLVIDELPDDLTEMYINIKTI